MNLYDRKFKLFKGVDKILYFNIKNHDRKPVEIPGKTLVCQLINQQLNQIMFSKPLKCEDFKQGNYQLFIRACDIASLPVGYYKGVIVLSDNNVNLKEFVYSGEDYNPVFEVFISNEIFPEFKESQKIDNKKWVYNGYVNSFISEPIPSARYYDLDKQLYTGCFYLKDALGTIVVDETYEQTPSMIDESLWVPVWKQDVGVILKPGDENYVKDKESSNWIPFTGNKGFSIKTQGNYFRFRFIPYINYYSTNYRDFINAYNPVEQVLFRF